MIEGNYFGRTKDLGKTDVGWTEDFKTKETDLRRRKRESTLG